MSLTSCNSQESQVTLPNLEQSTMEMENDVKPILSEHDGILQSSSSTTIAAATSTAISRNSPSAMDVTMAELLEKSVFNCTFCKNFFKTAVFAVQGHGTVCEICFKAHQHWKGGRLEFFDVFLKNLRFVPCAQADDGCTVQVLPETSALHKRECKYRPINCVSPGCPWQGKQDEFTDHFLSQHRKDVVKLSTTLDLAQESFVIVKLFIKNSFKYFLIVKHEQNSLDILYKILSVSDSDVRSVTIKHTCTDSDTYLVHIDTQDLNVIDKEWAWKKVNFLVLKMMFEGSNVLTISVNVSQLSKVEEKLRCSGCGKIMRPHIYQCEEGHGICSTCSTKMTQCLICEKALNKTRHLVLEALTNDLLYHCMHEQLGCKTKISGAGKIAQHESTCHYKPVSCLWPKCGYRNNYTLFKQHIIDLHKNTATFNTLICNIPDVSKESRSYAYVDDCLFELKLKVNSRRTKSTEWLVTGNMQLLNKEFCKSRYLCKFAIINDGKEEELIGKMRFTMEKPSAAPIVHNFRKDGVTRSFWSQFTKENL